MDIYALGLDDPGTRFGTSDDIRNWLLRLIIVSAAVSFVSCESHRINVLIFPHSSRAPCCSIYLSYDRTLGYKETQQH